MSTSPVRRRSTLGLERLEGRDVPSFSPFQLQGGESIAVGDVFPEASGITENEIVVGAGPGQQPYVRVYSPAGVLEAEFLAYEASFTGGVNVAVGNVVADPVPGQTDYKEIITGPGFGGGPVAKVFDPNSRTAVRQFVAFESSFRGGVNVASGNVNPATTTDEVVVGAGYGGGPVVRTFNTDGTAYSSFFAYESSFRNGVNVAVANLLSTTDLGPGVSGDEIATGPGDGGAPLLKVFTGIGTLYRSFFAFDQSLRNGLSVAAGQTQGVLPSAQVFAVQQSTALTDTPVFRSFNVASAGQILSQFTPFPAGYSRYYNMAVGDVNPYNTTGFDNAGDWVGVAGEIYNNQVPRLQYGITTADAGNNGP